jgi:hypothetical protein
MSPELGIRECGSAQPREHYKPQKKDGCKNIMAQPDRMFGESSQAFHAGTTSTIHALTFLSAGISRRTVSKGRLD